MNRGSAKEKNRSHLLDLSTEDQQSLDPNGSERALMLCTWRRVDLLKSQSPEVIWDHPSSGRTCGRNPSISGGNSLGGTRAHKFEASEA